MPEETVEVTLCSPEGPLHFLLQREYGKHTYLLITALVSMARLPTSLHTSTTEFTLKE